MGAGVIVTAGTDGAVPWTPPFPGQDGDRILLTLHLLDGQEVICVVLHEGPVSPAYRCDH